MTQIDLTPFYRSAIGIDRMASLMDIFSPARNNRKMAGRITTLQNQAIMNIVSQWLSLALAKVTLM